MRATAGSPPLRSCDLLESGVLSVARVGPDHLFPVAGVRSLLPCRVLRDVRGSAAIDREVARHAFVARFGELEARHAENARHFGDLRDVLRVVDAVEVRLTLLRN